MVEHDACSANRLILKPQTDHRCCPQEPSKEIKPWVVVFWGVLWFVGFFGVFYFISDVANSLISELNTINKLQRLTLQTSLEMS